MDKKRTGYRLLVNNVCRLNAHVNWKQRKRMGSGDPSGLQNRRELASLTLVSSTLTRFRQSQNEHFHTTLCAKPGLLRTLLLPYSNEHLVRGAAQQFPVAGPRRCIQPAG